MPFSNLRHRQEEQSKPLGFGRLSISLSLGRLGDPPSSEEDEVKGGVKTDSKKRKAHSFPPSRDPDDLSLLAFRGA